MSGETEEADVRDLEAADAMAKQEDESGVVSGRAWWVIGGLWILLFWKHFILIFTQPASSAGALVFGFAFVYLVVYAGIRLKNIVT